MQSPTIHRGLQKLSIKIGNIFSIRAASTSNFIERARLQENIRNDGEKCRESLAKGQFLPFYNGKPLLNRSRDLSWQNFEAAKSFSPKLEENFVFLGVDQTSEEEKILFAFPSDSDLEEGNQEGRFTEMRKALFTVDDLDKGQILSKSWSLLQWQRKTGFCANCGTKVARNFSGSSRSCSNCGSVYYPSLSPVGIVLIAASDHSKVMLCRQPRHPPGMYSCIAGFVDVGESLDACVRREAAEEVGVDVDEVVVHSSQHWPFPMGSLMVGCFALTDPTSTPDPCPVELEDARWFTPAELKAAFEMVNKKPSLRVDMKNEEGNIFVPPKEAIAHHLIKAWLVEHGHIVKES